MVLVRDALIYADVVVASVGIELDHLTKLKVVVNAVLRRVLIFLFLFVNLVSVYM